MRDPENIEIVARLSEYGLETDSSYSDISDIFYDEEPLKAQIKRKYAIYNGVLEDDTPEEHIKYNIELFFNGIHIRLFTGIGNSIDVYDNIYTHNLKYTISYI